MTDYTKAKIYKIEALNSDNGDIYIGSTCKTTLAERMTNHRATYRCWLKDNIKCSHIHSYDIFEKYGLENCHIYFLENYPCTKRDELRGREGYYIKTNACVNKQIPGQTQKEFHIKYYNDHKAEIKV